MPGYKITKIEEPSQIEDFLNIPQMLYDKRYLTHDTEEERSLIRGTHILSKYFEFVPFVAYIDDSPKARCALTFYPDDERAYLGFFECIDNEGFSAFVFDEVFDEVKKRGIQKIIGPVDASFWISYRMKLNGFEDRPYYTEPYNLPYYPRLWENSGFKVSEKYISNLYKRFPFNYENAKYKKRYDYFIENGYIISSPTGKEMDRVLEEIYEMMMELYSPLPVFKHIEKEDFLEKYKNYKYIFDLAMIKIVYKNERPVGFFIASPDYGNIFEREKGFKRLVALTLRKLPGSKYVVLHMGVRPGHYGLGRAMVQPVIDRLKFVRSESIAAFIHEKNIAAGYAMDKILGRKLYFLYEKELTYLYLE